MKVLFTFGGLPHYLVAQLNKLNEQENIEVVVIVPSSKSKTIGDGVKQSDEGIHFRVIYLNEKNTFYKKPFFENFSETIRLEKPEIIVTMWPYILAFVLYPSISKLIKKTKTKLILKEIPFMVAPFQNTLKYYKEHPIYNEDLEYEKTSGIKFFLNHTILAYIRKSYYRKINATVNYTDEAYRIIGSYGVKKEQIFVGYNSPDTEEIFNIKNSIINKPAMLSNNPHRLIHVGRLVKWKRVDLIINAVHNLKNKFPSIELIIIGTGNQEKNLKELVSKLSLENNIKFIGGVYDLKILGKYLLESSIYILGGMGGLSLNEAMCFGKPIICSVCDGTEKKLVTQNQNGLFFEENNLEDLIKQIDYLLSNPSIIEQMGRNSELFIKEKVNINTVMDAYMKAFQYVTTHS